MSVSEWSVSCLTYPVVCRLSYRLWSLAGRHVERSEKALFPSTSLLEIGSCLGFHAALRGNFVPTFRENLSVTSPPIGSDTSAWNYHLTLILDDGSDRLVWNVDMGYHSTLRKIPDDRRFQVHCGGSLKSRKSLKCLPLLHIIEHF